MISIPKGNPEDLGRWQPAMLDGKRTAIVSCPKCGSGGSLTTHSIDAEGNVNPSVVCPDKKCGFHEFVKLEGWRE